MENKEQQEPISTLTIDQLIQAGYTYKLDNLTEEEREEWMHGGKWTDPKTGQTVTIPSRDFDYFYKTTENGAEVQIFHVVQEFYYQGIRLMSADQLPAIEKSAQENKKWDDLIKTIPDDVSVEYKMPESLNEGQCIITLKGGPLDGQQRAYIKAAKAYIEVIGKRLIGSKIVSQAARYIQDPEETTTFIFKQII